LATFSAMRRALSQVSDDVFDPAPQKATETFFDSLDGGTKAARSDRFDPNLYALIGTKHCVYRAHGIRKRDQRIAERISVYARESAAGELGGDQIVNGLDAADALRDASSSFVLL
jgi:hypothetical protein